MASTIAAAELRVNRSRRELREALALLRSRLSKPTTLAAATSLGFLLGRTSRMGAVFGALLPALLRYTLRRVP
jgi:hypothetical protein